MAFNMIKTSILLFSLLLLQACATYNTVVPSAQKKHVQYVESVDDEKCVTIPRIYSGINYTFCVLCKNAKPAAVSHFAFIPVEFCADTIVLPYTIIRQLTDGNLVLKKERKRRTHQLTIP